MVSRPLVTVLPIGELDADLVRLNYNAIISAFDRSGADLFIAGPVTDEAGARLAVQSLSERNPDLLLLIPLRGLSAQAMETAALSSPAPCLIWPIEGRFALPSSALAAGALHQAGTPVEMVYGPPDHPASLERMRCILGAATAFSRLQRSRIGVIGGLFPNLVSCRYDAQRVSTRLGITLVSIPYDEIRESIQKLSPRTHELERAFQEITAAYAVHASDTNGLDAGIKLHMALKQIAHERKLEGFATECWTGLPREIGMNPCLGFIEDAYTLACEGDVMLCVALLVVRYLTRSSAYAGDLFDLDMGGTITLVHCGASASLASNKTDVVLAKSQLAMERGFDTFTCRPRLDPGLVTLMRLYGQDGDKLHVALGELSSSQQSPDLRVTVRLAGDRWNFLEQCFGNHYVVASGDLRGELTLLCKWLGISLFET